jgi:hypothetical protein
MTTTGCSDDYLNIRPAAYSNIDSILLFIVVNEPEMISFSSRNKTEKVITL